MLGSLDGWVHGLHYAPLSLVIASLFELSTSSLFGGINIIIQLKIKSSNRKVENNSGATPVRHVSIELE